MKRYFLFLLSIFISTCLFLQNLVFAQNIPDEDAKNIFKNKAMHLLDTFFAKHKADYISIEKKQSLLTSVKDVLHREFVKTNDMSKRGKINLLLDLFDRYIYRLSEGDMPLFSIKPNYADVKYANNSLSQDLDVFLPSNTKNKTPVIVFVHGGGFYTGDKDISRTPILSTALKRGYAIVSINYRLSEEAKFPTQIYDVKAAIRFVRANADKYNIDANKMAIWGGSAGGYLSAIIGTSIGIKELEDLSMGNSNYSSSVQAVVDWFGPIKFDQMDKQYEDKGIIGLAIHNAPFSAESKFLGKTVGESPDLVKKASPQTYITKNAPYFLIQHGTADRQVPVEQSINFASALKNVLGNDKVYFDLLQGVEHGSPLFETQSNLKRVFDFLDQVLK